MVIPTIIIRLKIDYFVLIMRFKLILIENVVQFTDEKMTMDAYKILIYLNYPQFQKDTSHRFDNYLTKTYQLGLSIEFVSDCLEKYNDRIRFFTLCSIVTRLQGLMDGNQFIFLMNCSLDCLNNILLLNDNDFFMSLLQTWDIANRTFESTSAFEQMILSALPAKNNASQLKRQDLTLFNQSTSRYPQFVDIDAADILRAIRDSEKEPELSFTP